MSSALFLGCSSSSDSIEQAHEVKEFRTTNNPESWANNMTISGEVENGADYLTINLTGTANTLSEMAHLQVYVDIDNDKTTGYSDGPIIFEGTVYDFEVQDTHSFTANNLVSICLVISTIISGIRLLNCI